MLGNRLAAGCSATFPPGREGGFGAGPSGKADGGQAQWPKKLWVRESGRTSLLVVTANGRAEKWLSPPRKLSWTGRRRQNCCPNSQ